MAGVTPNRPHVTDCYRGRRLGIPGDQCCPVFLDTLKITNARMPYKVALRTGVKIDGMSKSQNGQVT